MPTNSAQSNKKKDIPVLEGEIVEKPQPHGASKNYSSGNEINDIAAIMGFGFSIFNLCLCMCVSVCSLPFAFIPMILYLPGRKSPQFKTLATTGLIISVLTMAYLVVVSFCSGGIIATDILVKRLSGMSY